MCPITPQPSREMPYSLQNISYAHHDKVRVKPSQRGSHDGIKGIVISPTPRPRRQRYIDSGGKSDLVLTLITFILVIIALFWPDVRDGARVLGVVTRLRKNRKGIVSVIIIYYGIKNGMDGRARPGLCNEPLSVQSNPSHLEI